MLEKSTALLSLAILASACSAKEPTEIVGGVMTQIKVPEYLRSVGIVVQVQGEVKFCEVYPVTNGSTVLPATLGVLGAAGLKPSDTVTVQVLGLRSEAPAYEPDCVFNLPEPAETDNHEVMVIRRRRLTFIDGRILFLPLPLKESCSDVACSPDQTCIGGRCVAIEIDASTLPEYREPLTFGDTNTCFNGDVCMPPLGTLPPLLTDPSTCTFQVQQWPKEFPQPDTGDLNVRMYYASLGTEVLDLDPANAAEDQRDGFSFPDPNDPFTFRLARNVCETQYQADKILAVEASAFCPSKRPFQPLCEDYVAPNPRNTTGTVTSTQGAGLCTIAALKPVESVLYVLMDNSFPMYPFYGVGGLRFAIELPLSSPVARQAHVAFGSLPAAPEQCGTDAYASPQVPFGTVTEVRDAIGNILGTPLDQVAMINPPTVNLEAALQGAYAAIEAAPVSDGIAQRALVLISNRDLAVGACMGGQTALERVQQAASGPSRIATYAVALGDPNQNATADAATVATATGLAAAGRTRVFNAVANVADGATSVLDVLTDLGTCLYRVERSDLGVPGTIPDNSLISYIDPTNPSSSGVDIPFNPGCSNTSPAEVSGWNREVVGTTSLVRVCGNACTALRDVVSNVGSVTLGAQAQASTTTQQYTIPPVPVVVSAPCSEFISVTVNQ